MEKKGETAWQTTTVRLAVYCLCRKANRTDLEKLITEKMDEYWGCTTKILEDGVLFYAYDDNGEPEHVAEIAKYLVDTLQLPEPFYCSYAYWSDKPWLDEFGGGAFVVQLGKETVWCPPETYLRNQLTSLKECFKKPLKEI